MRSIKLLQRIYNVKLRGGLRSQTAEILISSLEKRFSLKNVNLYKFEAKFINTIYSNLVLVSPAQTFRSCTVRPVYGTKGSGDLRQKLVYRTLYVAKGSEVTEIRFIWIDFPACAQPARIQCHKQRSTNQRFVF